jgi:hypothetical protein
MVLVTSGVLGCFISKILGPGFLLDSTWRHWHKELRPPANSWVMGLFQQPAKPTKCLQLQLTPWWPPLKTMCHIHAAKLLLRDSDTDVVKPLRLRLSFRPEVKLGRSKHVSEWVSSPGCSVLLPACYIMSPFLLPLPWRLFINQEEARVFCKGLCSFRAHVQISLCPLEILWNSNLQYLCNWHIFDLGSVGSGVWEPYEDINTVVLNILQAEFSTAPATEEGESKMQSSCFS